MNQRYYGVGRVLSFLGYNTVKTHIQVLTTQLVTIGLLIHPQRVFFFLRFQGLLSSIDIIPVCHSHDMHDIYSQASVQTDLSVENKHSHNIKLGNSNSPLNPCVGSGSSILSALHDLPSVPWLTRSKIVKHLQVISVLQFVITFLAMGEWNN